MKVRGYLWGMLSNRTVADDLLQEVFLRAWKSREQFQGTGSVRGYLLRIADRLVYDLARKKDHEKNISDEHWGQIEPVSTEASPVTQTMQAETCLQIQELLQVVPPEKRRIILLRYYGQHTFSEIAEIIDSPLNTVLSHFRRGLLLLKEKTPESLR